MSLDCRDLGDLRRLPAGLSRLAVLGLWAAFALAVQRWPSWQEGIRVQYSADVASYEKIARAAPSLPDEHLLRPFAERFPAHWVTGAVADATGLALHPLYRAAELVCLALVLFAVHGVLTRLELGTREYALAIGAVAASAYPLHYLLAAPGMLQDAVFVVGLSLMLLGFARGRFVPVLAGLVVATLGRQTAIPVALAAAVWVAAAPAWRHARWRYAAATALVPLAVYSVLYLVAEGFADPQRESFHDRTVLGFGAHGLVSHLGRTALGVLVPSALVLGAWLRTRAHVPRGPLLVAAAIVAQPVLLGVASFHTEPRLAALAVPALAVAAGALLRDARLGPAETLVAVVAIAAGGLHHRYTHAGVHRGAEWAALEALAAIVVVAVLARRRPGLTRAPGALAR